MKKTLFVLLVSQSLLWAQKSTSNRVENLIFITLDGMRWQEVFGGIDTSIASNSEFNQGQKAQLMQKFYAPNQIAAREKLMPNFWEIFSKNGQIYGNRNLKSFSEVSNPYKISYPGYSEMFCGKVDITVKTNDFIPNPNLNFFEKFNESPEFRRRIGLFGAWAAFRYILNQERNHLYISSAFNFPKQGAGQVMGIIRKMALQSFKPFGENECLDVFTHFQAMEFLKNRKPKVLFIGYGETDEWAHAGKYAFYLQAAKQTDEWLAEIWNFVQQDVDYKDKTVIFITTDHGRGEGKLWTDHNAQTPKSEETWFAIISPGLEAMGEMKNTPVIYHKQFAKTISLLFGVQFESESELIPLKK